MICKTCGVELTDDNYTLSQRNYNFQYCNDCFRIKRREYQKTHYKTQLGKSSSQIMMLNWRTKNHETFLQNIKIHHLLQKKAVIEKYSGGKNCCVLCGFTDIRALSIDHINGGGHQHVKEIKKTSGCSFYSWLIKNNYPEGYQVLCMNCQFIKRDQKSEYKGRPQTLNLTELQEYRDKIRPKIKCQHCGFEWRPRTKNPNRCYNCNKPYKEKV